MDYQKSKRKKQIIEWKVYTRRRKKRSQEQKAKKAPIGVFPRMSIKINTGLIKFLRWKTFVNRKYIRKEIVVPNSFSFENNNNGSILFFKELLSTYLLSDNNIVINFQDCKSIDISNITLLDICIKELKLFLRNYNNTFFRHVNKSIKYIPSLHLQTNKCLYVFKLINTIEGIEDKNEGYLYLGLKKGLTRRISYKENTKGTKCKEIREFVNESLKASDVVLNKKGETKIDNLISEILNNAEDHSVHSEWYVNGLSYKNMIGDESIIEFNLAILNLGFSIHEGIEKTLNKNTIVTELINNWHTIHKRKMKEWNAPQFPIDDLYTLYSLQEGISRLKYEVSSRGNGTMNFIRAFIDLGAFGKENHQFKSHLNIISGNTIINCDNEIAPYKENNVFYLSLNKKKDINELPEKKYLIHNEEYFPGTILEVKIYLNKRYFESILKK